MRFLFDKIDWKALTENKRLKFNIGLAVILIIVFLFLIEFIVSVHRYRDLPAQENAPLTRRSETAKKPETVKKAEQAPAHQRIAAKPQRNFKGARVAIILDDAGGTSINYGRIFSIKQPLTIAVLPNLGTSQKVARDARNAGLEVILHMPMEPVNMTYVRRDGGMVLCSLSDEEITKMVEGDLGTMDIAIGMNNHEGSRATADERVMKDVLEAVKGKSLFFIDSKTTASSVVRQLASKLSVPTAENNIFLDTTTDEIAISARLARLVAIAKARGSAIGIGHATRRSTVDTLKKLMPEYAKEGVKFVFASELVK